MGRTSYSRLSRMPSWGLYDASRAYQLVMSVRAGSAPAARELFHEFYRRHPLERRPVTGIIRRIT